MMSLFFSICVYAQNIEENNAFYNEAVEKLKTDHNKSIKIYEYLINNAVNNTQKLNYQLDLIKIKAYVSKDTEALDIFFAIEKDVLDSDDQMLIDRYYIIGSDLFDYLGFKDEAQKLVKKIKSKDQKWIKSVQSKFFNIRYDLSNNSIVIHPIKKSSESILIVDSLQTANTEVEKLILLKKLENYYLKNNQLENYTYYNNQLNVLSDKLNIEIKSSQNYLVNKLLDQRKMQKKVEEDNLMIFSTVIGILLFGSIIFLIFYKKKSKPEEILVAKANLISDKVETTILSKLSDFEQAKGFLNPTITISILAKDLDTNIKYLSSILNNVKQKSFNNYINELRIDYIVMCLQDEKKYRLYKISHLAKLSGFISQSSFTTFFKLVTGVTPSIFIKNLNDNDE